MQSLPVVGVTAASARGDSNVCPIELCLVEVQLKRSEAAIPDETPTQACPFFARSDYCTISVAIGASCQSVLTINKRSKRSEIFVTFPLRNMPDL